MLFTFKNCFNNNLDWPSFYILIKNIVSCGTPPPSPLIMSQLWAIRFALLVKLKMYSNAEVEMSMFGTLETVDLYYE